MGTYNYNYTGREKLAHDVAEITAGENDGHLVIFFSNRFAENVSIKGKIVILEAYRQTKIQRVSLGLAEQLSHKPEIDFSEFANGNDVLFRIKIVEPESRRITAMAERLTIKKKFPGSDLDVPSYRKKSPISVRMSEESDEMNGRFWKVALHPDIPPSLILQRGKFANPEEVNSPVFNALVKPAIIKEVLTYAFIVRMEFFPVWAKDWLLLAKTVLGVSDDAPTEEPEISDGSERQNYCERITAWIDRVCGAFAKKNGYDKITSDFKMKQGE